MRLSSLAFVFFSVLGTAKASESSITAPETGVSQAMLHESCPQRPRGIRIGLVPIMNYTSDRGLTLGAMSRRFDYRTSCAVPFHNVLTLEASYATLGARIFEVAYEHTEISRLKLRSASVLSYTQNEFQPYYGIGPQSQYDADLDAQDYYRFTQKEILFENSLRKRFKNSSVEPQVGVAFARTAFSPSQELSQYEKDFGEAEKSIFTTRLFLRNVWEARDSEFIPSKGHYGLLGIMFSPSSLGNLERSWVKWDGDYRVYLPLAKDRALWLAHQVRYTGTTEHTPISEKARLGSVGTLRGLPFSRYSANHSASLRSDIRSVWLKTRVFDLPFKLGTGVFYDVGKIADTIPGLADERFHHSYGFSIFGSYFTDDFLGSSDFGFSEGNMIFYVRLGHPF